MNNITLKTIDGKVVAKTKMHTVPRIGEKVAVLIIDKTFIVTDVVWDIIAIGEDMFPSYCADVYIKQIKCI